jgi:transposase
MTNYTGCDAHKKYSVFVSMNDHGQCSPAIRVEHTREELRAFLASLPPGSPIAVETIGNWYWLIDELEQAGHQPKLAHAREAKRLMGKVNKTDKLDAKGLATLLRNGTLPEVWIPPGELRDQRELPRVRLSFGRFRTQLKNRIHAAFGKYGIQFVGCSDVFGGKGRRVLEQRLQELPAETQRAVREELELLDQVEAHIADLEVRIRQVVQQTPAMQRLKTLPAVGDILAIVLTLELGDVQRFPGAEHLASYAGTVPRISESGGHLRYGKTRPDVNRYLKWALVEAANVVVLNQERWTDKHVVQLYQRLRKHKGHAKAIVAVARHLAEAAYWVLKKDELYREPGH